MRLACSCGVVLATLTTPAFAQISGPGLTWAGTIGPYAGSFLPNCTAVNVAMVPGDNVTVRIWGDLNSPFVLGVAATATQCVAIPGFGNGLVLDLPAFPVVGGILSQTTPCLACPPGLQPLTFPVPLTLPLGASISLQAVGFGYGQPAFTIAITATV